MTCGFCHYEFCWACGASASSADNHFGFMRGCGVRMMDASVKPGDGKIRGKCKYTLQVIGLVILGIVLYPFFLVLFPPIAMGILSGTVGMKEMGLCGCMILAPLGFLFGIVLDICWIPLCLIVTLIMLAMQVFRLIRCIFCNKCSCQSERERRAEENNRIAAQENISRKNEAGREGVLE